MSLTEKSALFLASLLCLLLVIPSIFNTNVSGQSQSQYSAQNAFPNLSFSQPDGIFPDPTSANRLFVMEQAGVIKVFNNSRDASSSTVYLNITDHG